MKKFIHLKSCDSTQEVLKEQLTQTPTDELIISCDHQLKGHGRGENKWIDSPGTICFSLSVQPFQIPSFTAMELTVIIGKFFETKNQKIFLKWPNDLINSQGKKCGGVLIQTFSNQYMAGIGLNLYFDEIEFGGIYDQIFPFSKESWSQELALFIYQHRYEDLDKLKHDWLKMCIHLDKQVHISDNNQSYEGKFIGIGDYGEALIETELELKSVFNGSLRLG